jgi:nitronate monooxygenase
MFSLDQLEIPVLAAPMAGGPSTPQLVAAVTNAGASGFLAVGGGMPADDLAVMVESTRSLTSGPFGVNLFVPNRDEIDRDGLAAYRKALRPDAERYGTEAPDVSLASPSYWEEDLDWLVAHPAAFVSFTFGCPTAAEIARLREAGSMVVITVTHEEEAQNATELGADALCVQGPEAGGHRSTHHLRDEPDQRDLLTLVQAIRRSVEAPLIAAGGITQPRQVRAIMDAGASAVQIGTLFLRSTESGAHPVYKSALASGMYEKTQPARAFSGRFARGLVNRFMMVHHDEAPAAYPHVNHLTRPIRAAAAAAGDPESMSLWAGTGFRDAPEAPAAEIVRSLWQEETA